MQEKFRNGTNVKGNLLIPDYFPSTRIGYRTRSCSVSCVVCGDVSSGRHYGVVACNGCSGFFKRSVRRRLEYRCQGNGVCTVDKQHRNQCQACRLRKCLDSGMNRDAVQNERQPRNSATVRSGSIFSTPSTAVSVATSSNCCLRDVTTGVLPSFLVSPIMRNINASQFCSSESDNKNGSEVSSMPLKTFGVSTLPFPCFLSFEDSAPRPSMDIGRNTLRETSSRILLLGIQWARNMPSFASLSLQDQVCLLENTWSELFLLSCIQWALPLDTNPLFSTSPVEKSASISKTLHNLQRTFARFKMLATDYSEFACLKAIVLFKSDVESLKDAHHVEVLQDHSQLMLAHHNKSHHFDYTFRFGRHLLLLPTLREIHPDTVEALFFSHTPIEKLLRDVFSSAEKHLPL